MTDSTLTPSLIERVALAVRRGRYERNGRGKAYDPTLPLHETELADARVAVEAAEQAIRRDEAEKCLESVRGERLADPQEGTDDASYELALDHAEAAIRARHAEGEG